MMRISLRFSCWLQNGRLPVLACVIAANLLLAPGLASGAPATSVVEAKDACVLVLGLDQESKMLGHGSGFFLTDSGIVVTARHVIEDARRANGRLIIVFPSGIEWVVRNAVNADVSYLEDVAIVHTGKPPDTYLELANSDDVHQGDPIYAIGTPVSSQNFNTVTAGTVLGVDKRKGDIVALVDTYPGSSGGPLVDERGRVVGVVRAGPPDFPSNTYAIPSNALMGFAGVHVRPTRPLASMEEVRRRRLTSKETVPDKSVSMVKCTGVAISDLSSRIVWTVKEGHSQNLIQLLGKVKNHTHEELFGVSLRGNIVYKNGRVATGQTSIASLPPHQERTFEISIRDYTGRVKDPLYSYEVVVEWCLRGGN